uniref:NADH-ubiquinone oxidoreductase chain 4L n=1 Tax=Scoloplos cf. armiger CB-2006 TaxID=375448 RepID=Q19NU7_9ANNE|nr:NADH dehydrogenase subunit 4L [Scoloplos cf. armiger CB-2006]
MTMTPSDLFPLMIFMLYMSLSLHRFHFLMILLFLEAAVFILILSLSLTINNLSIILTLLTFAACEAALGLSCLVKLTHAFGSDQISALSINKC